ncbi:hypothetical protein KSP35_15985 [Aquihabitans sp. G128]|uniref:hypothetical protein n=1 Tax=Aquihabitans sp. G128 TaxID=2849779 RepID=UPI001C23E457|nr:hypothetical protein [Aquihabitans sp. G128]QXC59868.1 hypothetical protein KSP35_15985 [Aquihabitans sp. G128]
MTAGPAPEAHPAAPAGQRAVTATAVVATIGIVVALLGLFAGTRPLHTPTQDCGTAASFLLDGRVNELVDPSSPPKGTTKAEAEDNNATPCQERAANRARPAGAVVVAGTGAALVALFTELVLRWRLRRRANRRWLAEATAAAPPAPG